MICKVSIDLCPPDATVRICQFMIKICPLASIRMFLIQHKTIPDEPPFVNPRRPRVLLQMGSIAIPLARAPTQQSVGTIIAVLWISVPGSFVYPAVYWGGCAPCCEPDVFWTNVSNAIQINLSWKYQCPLDIKYFSHSQFKYVKYDVLPSWHMYQLFCKYYRPPDSSISPIQRLNI